MRGQGHRIDTRPEGTLLCVLAEEKRPKFFYVLWCHPGVHTALCTYVFLWKTSACTPGWRRMMAYFHVSTQYTKYRLSDTSGPVSILWLNVYHRVDAYTELWLVYPLFCARARQVTRCMHLIGWRLALKLAEHAQLIIFCPVAWKKVGTWKRKLPQCLQRSVTALYVSSLWCYRSR